MAEAKAGEGTVGGSAGNINTDKLVADLRQVIVDVEELLRATAGLAGERLQAGRERVEATLRRARTGLKLLEEHGLERARQAGRDADSYVHESPWQAIGITAGVAFLLGVLVSRR